MAHLDERTLERLLNREMSTRDIEAVLLHADACRDCAQKLEEWRDHFEELASIIPEQIRNSQAAMAFPHAFVLVSRTMGQPSAGSMRQASSGSRPLVSHWSWAIPRVD